ncbi:hypothetical protein QE152_g22176 [Popillia japonica]|uniref:Uncharacterized protein n=1 Tax=Popillia japonica TaxID=7064 RepID=A0AAW1KL60_POPJA
MILDQYEVKQCIEKKIEDNDTADAKKNDKKCKSILVQCIANTHLEYIKGKNTAYEMWTALKTVFEKHFLKFEEVVRELKSVGATLEDIDIVCHLLLTLPKNFDPIVTALETMDADKLKLEFVKGKLLDYEMKRRHEVTEACDTTAKITRL